MQVAIIKRPLEEPHCGDDAGCWQSGAKVVLCVVDGLGHGKGAEQAAKAAMEFVGRHYYEPLLEIFTCCDKALRHTRGVAMGIAVVDTEAAALSYAGIGNIRAIVMVAGQKKVSLTNNYGIVGGGYRKLTSETVPFTAGEVLILATDGIRENIDVSGCEDSLKADVQRLAEKIVQDWANKTDDIAVLVFRNAG